MLFFNCSVVAARKACPDTVVAPTGNGADFGLCLLFAHAALETADHAQSSKAGDFGRVRICAGTRMSALLVSAKSEVGGITPTT